MVSPELVKHGVLRPAAGALAVRKLMHEAALKAVDADCLSFLHTVRVVPSCRCSSYPPLRTGRRCMRPFWTRSWTSRWQICETQDEQRLQRGKPRLPPIPDPLPITIKIVK